MKIILPKYPVDVIISCKKPIVVLVYNKKNGQIIAERNEDPKTQVLKLPFNDGDYIMETSENCEIKFNKCLRYQIQDFKECQSFVKTCYNICNDLMNIETNKIINNNSVNVKVLDQIMDQGKWLNTPALVFTEDGQIWLDKKFMKDLTVSERVAIMCHERGHIEGNKKQNISIDNEYAADINGLILFCSMGFGQKDYLRAFQKTLNRSKSIENNNRQKVIEKTAVAIQNGEIYKKLYNIV